MSQKKSFTEITKILAPLNAFAGGLALVAALLIPCSQPRLQGLFALASQLFLASLVALAVTFLLLHGFWDTDYITGSRKRLVLTQLIIIAMFMIAALFVLGAAVIEQGNHYVGGFGIALVAIFVLAAIAGVIVLGSLKVDDYYPIPGGVTVAPEAHNVPRDLKWNHTLALGVLFAMEILLFIALLAFAIWKSVSPPVSHCDGVTVQLPSAAIPVSIMNPQPILSVTVTDIDTVVTFTDLDSRDSYTISTTIIVPTTITTSACPSAGSVDTTKPSPSIPRATPAVSLPAGIESPSSLAPCISCKLSTHPKPGFVTSTITSTIPCTTSTSKHY
jgi:succinate dehydrogenase hydrophobic anchor subunit